MQVAKAAEACAQAGSLDQGVEISMDMDQLLYDAGRLHDAICLMNRIKRALVAIFLRSRPRRSRGLSQWQHMMLSLITRRAEWPKPNPNRNRQGAAKTDSQQTRGVRPQAMPVEEASFNIARLLQGAAVQAGHRACPASAAQGRDDRRHHEGNRLAAAFGARLLRRRGQEEAQAKSRLRKDRRPAHLSDRKIRSCGMTSAATGRRQGRSRGRGRTGSAADHADRRICASATASCSGPNRPRRSVRTCFGAASRTGFRRRPMAASPPRPGACSISWSRPRRPNPTAGWNCPGGSSRAPNWSGPGRAGPIGSW